MIDGTTNDNDPASSEAVAGGPDAHGQAAMLLVESLLHALVARSVLTLEDAIEVVTVATEVKEEVAYHLGDTPETMRKSVNLLSAVARSLSHDLPKP